MIQSFVVAFRGIFRAIQSELNMKIHVLAVIVVSIAGLYFGLTLLEWVAVILCFMIVLGTEMLNTAIEKLADFVHPEKHPAIRDIKDIAAGAVLLCALGSIVVAVFIFLPHLK